MQPTGSRKNQADVRLNFDALDVAKVGSPPPQSFVEAFLTKSHDDAILEINRLAAKHIFIPLAVAPKVITKFCSQRLGTAQDAERLFNMVLQKYKIDPQSSEDPVVDKLFSELMWVYQKRVRKDDSNEKTAADLAAVVLLSSRRTSTATRTALCAFYNKIKMYQKTLDLHESWPATLPRDGSSYRYPTFAMLALNTKNLTQIQEMYLQLATEHTAFSEGKYLNDIYFIVDYVKHGLKQAGDSITEDEFERIERFYSDHPQLKTTDKVVRELIRASFLLGNFAKAQEYYTPCLGQSWLSEKTFQRILTGCAEHNLQEALALYKRYVKHPTPNCNKPEFSIDLHKRLLTSHGSEEYGAQKPVLVELKLWHVFSALFEKPLAGQDHTFVNIEIITGKGKKFALKKSVETYVKTYFGWQCSSGAYEGALHIRGNIKTLTFNKFNLPVRIDKATALQGKK